MNRPVGGPWFTVPSGRLRVSHWLPPLGPPPPSAQVAPSTVTFNTAMECHPTARGESVSVSPNENSQRDRQARRGRERGVGDHDDARFGVRSTVCPIFVRGSLVHTLLV